MKSRVHNELRYAKGRSVERPDTPDCLVEN